MHAEDECGCGPAHALAEVPQLPSLLEILLGDVQPNRVSAAHGLQAPSAAATASSPHAFRAIRGVGVVRLACLRVAACDVLDGDVLRARGCVHRREGRVDEHDARHARRGQHFRQKHGEVALAASEVEHLELAPSRQLRVCGSGLDRLRAAPQHGQVLAQLLEHLGAAALVALGEPTPERAITGVARAPGDDGTDAGVDLSRVLFAHLDREERLGFGSACMCTWVRHACVLAIQRRASASRAKEYAHTHLEFIVHPLHIVWLSAATARRRRTGGTGVTSGGTRCRAGVLGCLREACCASPRDAPRRQDRAPTRA